MTDNNGWSNRQTWNANLWVFNDEGLYARWKETNAYLQNLAEKGYQTTVWDRETAAHFLLSVFPNGKTPDDENLLLANMQEIADAWCQSALEHHPQYDAMTGKIAEEVTD